LEWGRARGARGHPGVVAARPADRHPGGEFDVRIEVPASGSAFNAFDVVVGYDPAVLTLLPTSPTTLQQGCLFTGVCGPACSGGTIHWFSSAGDSVMATVSMLCNGVSVTGPGTIYQLRFRASNTVQVTTLSIRGKEFFDAGVLVTPVSSTGCQVGIGIALGVPAREAGTLRVQADPNPAFGAVRLTITGDGPAPARGGRARRVGAQSGISPAVRLRRLVAGLERRDGFRRARRRHLPDPRAQRRTGAARPRGVAAVSPRLRHPVAALVLSLVALLVGGRPAAAQTVRTDLFVTNGQVNAQALQDGVLYVGGSFSRVGALTGAGLPVDSTTGLPDPGFPRVTGVVLCAASDGASGWYIGGQFTDVNGVPRANLAHVRGDHSLDAWNPGTNGAVRTMVLSGGQLYVGGDFTTIGATARNRVGSVDTTAGAVSAWNPNANSSVRDLELHGGNMLVAGQFTAIGGMTRNRIAQVDLGAGAATPTWNPNANSPVLALKVSGNTLYVGGQFTSIGGQARNRIAALTLATGVPTTWNPNANNTINALAAADGVVYAGGQFSLIGGVSRLRIAALDSVTAVPTAWNPSANAVVQTVALSGGSLYAGGDFLTIGGQSRSRVAELSVSSGLATAWNPSAFSTVNVIELDAPEVFLGGVFTAVGGTARNNLAAFDVSTGAATAWNPNANNQVQTVALQGGTLYVGGNFTQVGGQVRNNIAALGRPMAPRRRGTRTRTAVSA
jgi:hypothetical protein